MSKKVGQNGETMNYCQIIVAGERCLNPAVTRLIAHDENDNSHSVYLCADCLKSAQYCVHADEGDSPVEEEFVNSYLLSA